MSAAPFDPDRPDPFAGRNDPSARGRVSAAGGAAPGMTAAPDADAVPKPVLFDLIDDDDADGDASDGRADPAPQSGFGMPPPKPKPAKPPAAPRDDDAHLTPTDLKEAMAEPRYFRDREPAATKAVTKGFELLYPGLHDGSDPAPKPVPRTALRNALGLPPRPPRRTEAGRTGTRSTGTAPAGASAKLPPDMPRLNGPLGDGPAQGGRDADRDRFVALGKRAGALPEDLTSPDTAADKAEIVRRAQRAIGAAVDGVARPGGETERKLHAALGAPAGATSGVPAGARSGAPAGVPVQPARTEGLGPDGLLHRVADRGADRAPPRTVPGGSKTGRAQILLRGLHAVAPKLPPVPERYDAPPDHRDAPPPRDDTDVGQFSIPPGVEDPGTGDAEAMTATPPVPQQPPSVKMPPIWADRGFTAETVPTDTLPGFGEGLPEGLSEAAIEVLIPPETPPLFILENRLGNPDTQQADIDAADAATWLGTDLGGGYEHLAGGLDGDRNRMEQRLIIDNPRSKPGTIEGGIFPDAIFQHEGTGRRLLIQTVDVGKRGNPTARERRAADRLHVLTDGKGDLIVLLPKPATGKRYDQARLRDVLRPLMEDLKRPKSRSQFADRKQMQDPR